MSRFAPIGQVLRTGALGYWGFGEKRKAPASETASWLLKWGAGDDVSGNHLNRSNRRTTMSKENEILATALRSELPAFAIECLCAHLAREIAREWQVPITAHEINSMVDAWIDRHRPRASLELQA